MSFQTAKKRVSGLGSAHSGAHHWWVERLTSVALIPLTLCFLCTIVPLIGASHIEVVAAFQSPLRAIATILFLAVTFKHLKDGLQVVIEDYVHSKGTLAALLMLNTLGCGLLGFAGIFAVAKLAFS